MNANTLQLVDPAAAPADAERPLTGGSRRRRGYPLSSRYLIPLVARMAERFAISPLRPWHLTTAGLAAAVGAAATLLFWPTALLPAAGLVWLAWFCDRADGQLARAQQRATPLGGWLDANIDELVDVLLHAAVAAAAVASTGAHWPLGVLAAFLAGKYLFMYGLNTEAHFAPAQARPEPVDAGEASRSRTRLARRLVQVVYHAPANADVRIHLLIVALASGLATWELVFVAGYYNMRWLARYGLVIGRLAGAGAESDRVASAEAPSSP